MTDPIEQELPAPDPQEFLDRLLRDLRSSRKGISTRAAQRRLTVSGPNELVRRPGEGWIRELLRQFTHPLALLLWVAAALAVVSDSGPLAVAIVVVIVINAAFAFVQERHAEQAVEALAAYLPQRARVLRDGRETEIDARDLVPGDVIIVSEGDRVSADARLLTGSLEMDTSTLTGESAPVAVAVDTGDSHVPLIHARDVVFSGTTCTAGEATAVVFATGMRTELGRIAALSQRAGHQDSPLERQVKRVARLIALVAVGMGLAFIPLGTLMAGLSLTDALNFAIGLIVANVPDGLLPTITLALAVGVRTPARRGALVKRISAVETLGSTSVICTDKTGTLILNRMSVRRVWTTDGMLGFDGSPPRAGCGPDARRGRAWPDSARSRRDDRPTAARGAGRRRPVPFRRNPADRCHRRSRPHRPRHRRERGHRQGRPARRRRRRGRRDDRRRARRRPRLDRLRAQRWWDSAPAHDHADPRRGSRDGNAPGPRLGAGTGRAGTDAAPPRPRSQSVIDGPMLARAWGLLGGVSAVLVMGLLLLTLVSGGWTFGADTSSGPLHHTWQQATTMTFLEIVACQIGTAVAARTGHASLAEIGFTTNPLLLWGIAFEVVFAAAVVAVPLLQDVFGTTLPEPWQLALLLPLPVLVWGCDEVMRAILRSRAARRSVAGTDRVGETKASTSME